MKKTEALKYNSWKRKWDLVAETKQCATAKGIWVKTRIKDRKTFFCAEEHFDQGNR